MKRVLTILVLLMAVTGVVLVQAQIKNPDTLIMAAPGDVDSLDMAKAYDNVSWSMLALLYDRLIDFDGANLSKFVPKLATEVPTIANKGISADGLAYTFKIRQGVKFHNGETLTAEDVAYSFRRNMVTDTDGGPDWIWFQVFGLSGSRDDDGKFILTMDDLTKAVEVKGTTVVFHLAKPFPPFLSVLCGKWASIVSKKWITEQGGWDGTAATMAQFNNPPTGKETLLNIANGTGPYKLVRWEKGVEVAVTRNDAYWGPKPSLKNGLYKVVDEQATRKLMLLQGDADIIYVPATNFPEMAKEKGITIYKDLPSLDLAGMHFNMKINDQDNPATYSGKLDGQGIPADFFSDKNLRLAFNYAWDEKTFIKDGMNGNAIDPVTPFPRGLPYKNAKLESKPFDLKKAADYFKKAWGGQVWDKGFKFDILFNSGNTERETGAKILAENVMSLNPRFQIGVRGVEFPTFLDLRKNKRLPIYFLGWAPDYPDPDNYAFPYMHSSGDFGRVQGYNNPVVDDLVKKAGVELDASKRQAYYYQLQDIWLEDAITILASQPLRQRFVKDWVKGYYYSPMESQEIELLPILKKQ
jgi:peptide/nickel transport system substrate-binding protein